MTDVRRRRLRLAAGLTLLALSALELGYGAWALLNPLPYTQLGGLALLTFVGVPTLLAAIAILLGGTKSGIFGGVVSLLYSGALALGMFNSIDLGGIGAWDVKGLVEALPYALGAAVALVAYAFAGIASLLTRHARDKLAVGPTA